LISRIAVFAGVSAICLAGVAGSYSHAAAARNAAASPKNLVLTVHDMPAKFKFNSDQAVTGATEAKRHTTESKELTRDGLIASYLAEYRRPDLSTGKLKPGLVDVISGVASFKSVTGAHAYLKWLNKTIPASATFKGAKVMSFTRLGTETIGYTYKTKQGSTTLTFDTVAWRRGSNVALLFGGGLAMSLGKQDSAVTALARKGDQRLASKG
jgi:hypothetical protein